jgi:hypothetical protein
MPFIQKYFNSVLRIINAFPLQNANNVLTYEAAGNLNLLGGLQSVKTSSDGRFVASFRPIAGKDAP